MAALSGLTGMTSDTQDVQYYDQGVLESQGIQGGPDPAHGHIGDALTPVYPAGYGSGYHGSVYPPVIDRSGERGYVNFQGGVPIDDTPVTHTSPYPTGIWQPDLETPGSYASTADVSQTQAKLLHGRDLGGVRKFNGRDPAGRQTDTHYTTDRYEAPNQNELSPQVPGQIKGTGTGLKDTTQGYGQLNSLNEFQRGHSIRRIQHDHMVWDRSLDYQKSWPFPGRFPVKQAQFTNDSPYGEVAGDTSKGQQVVWENRIGYPTPYQPPAVPIVMPANAPEAGDVWAW